ncbi:MAG: ATP-binding protein [Anaerolineae bacterium]
MTLSASKFSQTLTAAIRTIKARTGKKIEIIQDEIGFELGRNGGSYIAYLRKNNLPSDFESLELLARHLINLDALDDQQCFDILISGGHPEAKSLVTHWFKQVASAGDAEPNKRHQSVYQKPFIVGPPIGHPRQFFGRKRETRRIFNFLSGLPFEHTAIIGPRRSGKTSLLHYLQQLPLTDSADLRPDQIGPTLPHPERYQTIYVDFQDPRMRSLPSLLRHLLKGMGGIMPEPALADGASLDLDTFMDLVGSLLSQRPTIIMFDELSAGLTSPSLDLAFWWAMRSMINLAGNGGLAFMLSSSGDPASLADDNDKASPFFNIFNTIQLGPLTKDESVALILSSPIPIPDDIQAWMLEQSGRWPCLLQILCREYLDSRQAGETDDLWRDDALAQFKNYPDLTR